MNEFAFDEKLLKFYFDNYYKPLCYYAMGYITDEYRIKEIVSDVFIRLWNNRANIKSQDSVYSYLIQSVKNACIDYYRSEKTKKEMTLHIEENQIVCTTLADLNENPLEYIITKEQEEKIIAAIEKLPERCKMTLKFSKLDKLSYNEIASEMNISVNTVKSNLRDAISKLKAELKDILISILA